MFEKIFNKKNKEVLIEVLNYIYFVINVLVFSVFLGINQNPQANDNSTINSLSVALTIIAGIGLAFNFAFMIFKIKMLKRTVADLKNEK